MAEANLSKDLVQAQPLPDLVADMNCSGLPGLFDFDLLQINANVLGGVGLLLAANVAFWTKACSWAECSKKLSWPPRES